MVMDKKAVAAELVKLAKSLTVRTAGEQDARDVADIMILVTNKAKFLSEKARDVIRTTKTRPDRFSDIQVSHARKISGDLDDLISEIHRELM